MLLNLAILVPPDAVSRKIFAGTFVLSFSNNAIRRHDARRGSDPPRRHPRKSQGNGEWGIMAEVVKVMQEQVPALRFIGKRYTKADGPFGKKWGEWFREGRFGVLEALGSAPEHEGAYIGLMRSAGEFEYWIGMFFPLGTQAPEGYDFVDLPACTFATCWLYGRENTGELFGDAAQKLCFSEIEKEGWKVAETPWIMERYNCPRYTDPDEHGNVILDYLIQLAG